MFAGISRSELEKQIFGEGPRGSVDDFLEGASSPDGWRYPLAPETQTYFKRHPENPLAKRNRELEQTASWLRQVEDRTLREYKRRMRGFDTKESLERTTKEVLAKVKTGSSKKEVLQLLRKRGLININDSLDFAVLDRANLHRASLTGEEMPNVDLRGADLLYAALDGTTLEGGSLAFASLVDANLSEADLSEANLRGANLVEADLSGANLTGARGITNEELKQKAKSLEGATMPNGQKYEEWSKSRREDGKHSSEEAEPRPGGVQEGAERVSWWRKMFGSRLQ